MGVLNGVLDILMAYPVFHIVEVSSGIEQVGADGVFQDVKSLLLCWELRLLSVIFSQSPKHGAINGSSLLGKE